MSTETVVYLVCDAHMAETCTNRVGDGPRAPWEDEARLAARRQGWARVDDRLDVCPSCRSRLPV